MPVVGETCRLQGLVSGSQLNGTVCTVVEFIEARARYAVQVGAKRMLVKPENIVSVLPDPLADAAKAGDDGAVLAWLAGGGDVDAPWFSKDAQCNGNTMLMLASNKGHERMVKLLLKHGAEVNAVNDGGVDALLHAAGCMEPSWASCIKCLVRAKADVDRVSDTGGNARDIINLKLGTNGNNPVVHGRDALVAQEMLRVLDRAAEQNEASEARMLAEATANVAAAALLAEEDRGDHTASKRRSKTKKKGRRGKASQDQPKEDADPDSTEKGLSAAVNQLELSGTPLSTDEQTLCVVCMDAPKTHAIVPCGHVCICEGCTEKLVAARSSGAPRVPHVP